MRKDISLEIPSSTISEENITSIIYVIYKNKNREQIALLAKL